MKIVRKLFFALLISGFFSLGVSAFTPFVAPFLSGLGFTGSEISYMNSLGSVGIILIAPLVTALSDKVGRKAILILALLVEIGAISILPNLPRSFAVAGLVLAFQTIAAVIFNITILSFIEDNIERKKRGFHTGINESIFSIGVFLGPLLGAYLILRTSFGMITKFSTILFVVILWMILFLREEIRVDEKIRKMNEISLAKNLKNFWKNKRLRGMGILGIAVHFSMPLHYVFLPLFIIQDLRAPISYVGIIVGASVSINLLQFVHGWFCDKIERRKMIIIGLSINACATIAMTYVTNVRELFILVIIQSIGLGIWNTSTICHLSAIGEDANKEGEVIGSYVSIAKVGAFLSFIISGYLVSIVGIRMLFLIYGTIIALGLLVSLKYLFFKPMKCPLFENSKP